VFAVTAYVSPQGLMTARYIARPNSTTFLITAGHGVLYKLDTKTEKATPVSGSTAQVGDMFLLPSG
jgi:hypothetical protein